ncbi:MAG: hypothetical protein ACLVBK_02685 [Oscillospiraceae bacterium]
MKRIFNGSGGRKAALILSLCLIFALAVGTTLAYLKANTSPVTNTFTAAKSDIKIDENVENGEKSSIQVENIGTATSYVRVKLVMNWVDKSGNVVSGGNLPEVTLNEPDWFMKDGIYYYTKAGRTERFDCKPAERSHHAAECARGLPPRGDGAGRESIQAAPSTAVEGAWAVTVVNGALTSAIPTA